MFVYTNPNPRGSLIGDCSVRAVAVAMNTSWDRAYDWLTEYGRREKNMPNADSVWGMFLKDQGFSRHAIPNTCPMCYTIRDFCLDHPKGVYVVGTGTHVVAIVDGDYYDTWDSGDEVPAYYWRQDGIL
jgi:hypothetical protein